MTAVRTATTRGAERKRHRDPRLPPRVPAPHRGTLDAARREREPWESQLKLVRSLSGRRRSTLAAGGRRQVGGGRWGVAGGRRQVGGGRWATVEETVNLSRKVKERNRGARGARTPKRREQSSCCRFVGPGVTRTEHPSWGDREPRRKRDLAASPLNCNLGVEILGSSRRRSP